MLTELTFDLNSAKWPPQVKELVSFEEDLIKLVKNITFRKVDNKFQTCEKHTSVKENFNSSKQNVKYISL